MGSVKSNLEQHARQDLVRITRATVAKVITGNRATTSNFHIPWIRVQSLYDAVEIQEGVINVAG